MLNPDRTRRCIAASLLSALAACAPLEWHKDGAAADEILRDRNRCTDDARSEAFRQRAPLRNPVPQVVVDPQGRIIATRPASPDNERFALEQEILRKCMHDLGYELEKQSATTTP